LSGNQPEEAKCPIPARNLQARQRIETSRNRKTGHPHGYFHPGKNFSCPDPSSPARESPPCKKCLHVGTAYNFEWFKIDLNIISLERGKNSSRFSVSRFDIFENSLCDSRRKRSMLFNAYNNHDIGIYFAWFDNQKNHFRKRKEGFQGMPKTYLIRIDDEETWRKFHSICALKGLTIKDALWAMIMEFVKTQGKEVKKRSE
jgi:hypothetical protein